MDKPTPESMDAQEKFMAFLVASMGADITAPEGVFTEELKSFKEARDYSSNDEAVDSLVAVSRVDSPQERLEIIEILIMKLLTLNNISKLAVFLRNYTHHVLEYLNEHPECREEHPQDKAMDAIKDMFGGL